MPTDRLPEPLHSEEVDDIISSTPDWIIRWGISLFFVILLTLFLFSALIKSPEVIEAKLKVDAENRPQEVIARKEGRLVKLYVKAGQQVKTNELLGLMESSAQHEQVLALSQLVDSLQTHVTKGQSNAISSFQLSTAIQYGELQPAVNNLLVALQQYKAYIQGGVFDQKQQLISDELINLERLEQHLLEEERMHLEEFELFEKEFQTYRALAGEKVISPIEFNQHKMRYIGAKLPLQQARSTIISNRLSHSLKLKEKIDIEQQIEQQHDLFLGKLQQFKSELYNWKLNHILVAERDGVVEFLQVIDEMQRFNQNEPIMYIAGEDGIKPFGILTLRQQASGNIKVGQEVLIRMHVYPSQEYGLLKGRIVYISNTVSSDSTIMAKVFLPTVTTYQKSLNLQIGFTANAEVITQEYSLLGQILKKTQNILIDS